MSAESSLGEQGKLSEAQHAEDSFTEKVGDLRENLATISAEAESPKPWPRDRYLQALEDLRNQVETIHQEWETVSANSRADREKLEAFLQSFPGAVETATLRALSLRVSHLESLVSQLFEERQSKESADRARKQMIISLVALGVTIVIWGLWIAMAAQGLNLLPTERLPFILPATWRSFAAPHREVFLFCRQKVYCRHNTWSLLNHRL